MDEKLNQIQITYLQAISQSTTLAQLDEIFLSLFGKNGEMTLLPKEFSKLGKEELKKIGPLFNKVKIELEDAIENKRNQVREEQYKKLYTEQAVLKEDTPIKPRRGHMHPVTQFKQEVATLFEKLNFQLFEAPHIDTDFNNFEVLNIPQDHPARDLWDTFYLQTKEKQGETVPARLLLRTHTSNGQIHIMKQYKPPIRLMIMGRCFRYENLDARHEHTFEQFELVYIDKGLSMANLQYLSEYFLRAIFGPEIKVRLKPKYYPFVEPGAGVDGLCIFCNGKGCKICGGVGWLELAGAGMIHPVVLKNGGIDPNEFSGIAWGMGLERIVMLKNGIEDIRLFKNGDLKFLERF